MAVIKVVTEVKITYPTAAFFDLLRHQRDAGAAAAAPGEHPSACHHDYT
jgi:hypothetical protein